MPILQINFKLEIPADAYGAASQQVAEIIAGVPGLRWKIWLLNEAESEAGGIYCFETKSALEGYLSGPIVGQLRALPVISDLNIKRFDAIEDLTRITRGPALAAFEAHS
jgi:hypothetical protein